MLNYQLTGVGSNQQRFVGGSFAGYSQMPFPLDRTEKRSDQPSRRNICCRTARLEREPMIQDCMNGWSSPHRVSV